MKEEFYEDLQSERRDPVDAPFQDFDWDKICDRIDGDVESGE